MKDLFDANRDSATKDFDGAKSFFSWIDDNGPKLLASPRTSPKFNATWTTHALMRLPTAAELRQAIVDSYDQATETHYKDVFDAIEKDYYVPKDKKVFLDLFNEFDRNRKFVGTPSQPPQQSDMKEFAFKGIDANGYLPALHEVYLECNDKIIDHRFLRDVPEAHAIMFDTRPKDSEGRLVKGAISNHEMNRAAAEAFNVNKSFVLSLDNMFVKADPHFKATLDGMNVKLATVDHVDGYRALVGRSLEREARVR